MGKLPDLVRTRVDVVTGSQGDAEVVDRAFADAEAVFWVAPVDRGASSLDVAYSGFTSPPRRRSRSTESDMSSASRRSAAALTSPAAPGW